jgi:hypothetical protein
MRQYCCSLATHFSSRFLSLIQDILVIVGAVQVLPADTAPLLGPFSNVEYRFISALGTSYKILKSERKEHLLLTVASSDQILIECLLLVKSLGSII